MEYSALIEPQQDKWYPLRPDTISEAGFSAPPSPNTKLQGEELCGTAFTKFSKGITDGKNARRWLTNEDDMKESKSMYILIAINIKINDI